jgi:hypothetical protein
MTRLDALRALYDAVKAGTFCQSEVMSQEEGALIDLCFEPLAGDVAAWEYVSMALSDELSAVGAALAFISATLPGWDYCLYKLIDDEAGCDLVRHDDHWMAHEFAANPATAMLLAGLVALMAEEEAK